MSETAGLPQRNSLPGRLHLTKKRGNDMITFLLILCAVFMVGGFVAYNPLRRKMDGIIGVGGAYFILIGILMLFASIGQIAGTISGTSNVSALEIILGIAVAVAGLGYMVIVMLSRCQTVGQRILLPLCRHVHRVRVLLAAARGHLPAHAHGEREEERHGRDRGGARREQDAVHHL